MAIRNPTSERWFPFWTRSARRASNTRPSGRPPGSKADMGIRDYLKKSGNQSRLRLSAVLAVLFHALILAGGSLVMATQAEYGIAGSVAGGGQPQKVVPPEEPSVD